ncbi:hypothetical protein C1645_842155 [Glomus cerebriforme]|uniref:Uncharacterized protein n=1 Tax=Glomus cerebriforme TaxID=658196 RepID=A0A397S3D7_9GLOM|nr:hypothetical protein C1645_842155 [Glomus cerebriforme]
MMLINEEESNKHRNVENTSSSISDTSNNNIAKFLKYLEFLCFRIKILEKNIKYDNFMNDNFIKVSTFKMF